MKLARLAQELASWTETAVILDEAFCLHGRDRYSECSACSQICPVGAITPLSPPILEPELCRDCRACLAACPTGACLYTGRDAVDAVLNTASAAGIKHVELLCSYNGRQAVGMSGTEAGLRVRGCLAGLGVAIYLNLVAAGAETVTVRADACADCAWTALAKAVANQVKAADRLLGVWSAGSRVALVGPEEATEMTPRPLWQAESPPRSRRQLLAAIAGEDGDLKKEGDGQRFYRERLRLVRGIRALPPFKPGPPAEVSLAEMGFAALTVARSCTACGACARACPTEALTFTADDESFRLGFEPQLCVSCEACVHVCAPQSITVDHAPTFGQVFGTDEPHMLARGALERCSRCGAGFAARSGLDLCPVCEFRERNPFGSFVPPGARLRGARRSAAEARSVPGDH